MLPVGWIAGWQLAAQGILEGFAGDGSGIVVAKIVGRVD